jgi:hypothetical protein
MTIQSTLPDDNYKPTISKPSLQQYDNYQINDLYCIDIVYLPISDLPNVEPPEPILKKSFLAVEVVAPNTSISCDFNTIANTYK